WDSSGVSPELVALRSSPSRDTFEKTNLTHVRAREALRRLGTSARRRRRGARRIRAPDDADRPGAGGAEAHRLPRPRGRWARRAAGGGGPDPGGLPRPLRRRRAGAPELAAGARPLARELRRPSRRAPGGVDPAQPAALAVERRSHPRRDARRLRLRRHGRAG